MQRRRLLRSGLGLAAGGVMERSGLAWPTDVAGNLPFFSSANRRWQAAYDRALTVLEGNVQVLPRYPKPVLVEGAEYAGIWMECGPMEALVYRRFRPDVARNSHMVFFDLQHSDGQLPANNKRSEAGFGQIQMVVPIAVTAWELARATGDSELLEKAYASCSRWDTWLMRYRNTRGTGLIEGFCTYDTGMDNSPRWAGVPPQCPEKNAKVCPPLATLPRLCPDLSATAYGARVALGEMAVALHKPTEAEQWHDRAQAVRKLILERLYEPQDGAFYDLDAQDRFVEVRCDILSRVCGEHVVSQQIFDEMWKLQLGNPAAFWAPYPLPSIALNDPHFVRPIPRNSWGGASQALTALRAGRWMEHYGRAAEFAHMMEQWCEALQRDMSFRQQMDPLTGEFTRAASSSYSPACLVMFAYTWKLGGVEEKDGVLEWNIRPDLALSAGARFKLPLRSGSADMSYTKTGTTLKLNGREVAEIHGVGRVVTDRSGELRGVLGTSRIEERMSIRLPGRPRTDISVRPNVLVKLQA